MAGKAVKESPLGQLFILQQETEIVYGFRLPLVSCLCVCVFRCATEGVRQSFPFTRWTSFLFSTLFSNIANSSTDAVRNQSNT